MYLLLTASKDAYITDKIIKSSYRVTDANTGRAGTIDLFKLYNETLLEGEADQVELSRALIKFDLDPLKSLTGSILNIDNFKCFLSLSSANTGLHTPNNFQLDVFPLSQSWDEGIGRDTSSFSDIDVVNFITASYRDGAVYAWNEPGANKRGLLGSDDIDIISSGTLDEEIEDLFVSQDFVSGNEDLYVDVTKIVSATLSGILPDCGFRISFSEAEETDQKTRFVKRFYSRHTNSAFKQPFLRVLFDDSIKDDHNTFYFNTTGSLFLTNTILGKSQQILSGSDLSVLEGDDCLLLKLTTGSHYELVVSASNFTMSATGEPIQGLYRASFCIPYADTSLVISGSQNATIYDIASSSGSIEFKTEWCSIDQTVTFATGSVKIKKPNTNSYNSISQNPSIKIVNLKPKFSTSESVRFRLFGRNLDNKIHPPVKIPIYAKSEFFEDVFYRVRSKLTGEILIPFDAEFNSTRISRDSEGLFFDFKMSNLFPGRDYYFEFLIKVDGREHIDSQDSLSFRVDK